MFKDGDTVFASVPKSEAEILDQIPDGVRCIDFGDHYFFPTETVSKVVCPKDKLFLRKMVAKIGGQEGRN
jgi:hypothetical protein